MIPNITLLLKQNTKDKFNKRIKLNNKIIAWAANENSKKIFSDKNCWTIQTTESYSKNN